MNEAERGQNKPLSKAATIGRLEVIYQSVEVMQSTLTQYKIAGYPPDVLIEIPKEACRFYEFHRAREMIAIGRDAACRVLDRYEGGEDHRPPVA
jgi:NTE family protein